MQPVSDMEAINIEALPIVEFCGVVSSVNEEAGSFTMEIMQWTPFGQARSICYVEAHIAESARYKDKRPLPRERANVHIHGWVAGHHEDPTRIIVDVQNITFIARASLPPARHLPPSTSTSSLLLSLLSDADA